ncbi:hypothetical protein GCM10009555_028230 [Acrocarpospora macrocephala]|uniref:ABC3 transporter permease protein domain-containing protein n=1 Tax=Acrocarpospora macrocephala TaxID=150177 RepID=A0A5M3X8I0_9ACTN|nr:hypothetical protein [Acrocarpospora macrocephala]GES17002.1 hypothetical protein Amac_106000 [Acrocarpospora macrocephala]
MLHGAVKLAYAFLLAIAASVSFVVLWDRDGEIVLGANASVFVPEEDHEVAPMQVVQRVEEFASRERVAVARLVLDFREPFSAQHLYLATPSPHSAEAAWLTQGYPAFSGQMTTSVHPISEAASLDARGYYYVFGSAAAGERLLAELGELGLRGSMSRPLSPRELINDLRSTPIPEIVLAAILAAVAFIGVGVLLGARGYAVQRLHGRSYLRILGGDLRGLAGFWAGAAVIEAVMVLAFLAWYNGWAWISLYAVVAGILAAGCTAVAVAAHALALTLALGRRLPAALKGELPTKTAALGAYLIRVPVLLISLSLLATVVTAGEDISDRYDHERLYQRAGTATYIYLKGISGEAASADMAARVGGWLREADRDGQVLLAARAGMQDQDGNGSPDHEVMFVNDTFLDHQAVVDPRGGRYQGVSGSDPGTIRVIIPESLAGRARAIADDAVKQVTVGHPEQARAAGLTWHATLARKGQSVFGYGSAPGLRGINDQDNSMIDDPVLVVLPNGSIAMPVENYMAYATQGQLIFRNPDDVRAGIDKHGLHTYVAGIQPIREVFAQEKRALAGYLSLNLIAFWFAVCALVVTAVGICMIYVRKNSQLIFVRHISGWRFTATHRVLLAAESALAATLAGWVPFRVGQENMYLDALTVRGIPLPYPRTELTIGDIASGIALAALTAGVMLLVLHRFHRQIAREGASSA